MDTAVTPSTRNNAPTFVERTDPIERQQRQLKGDMSHIPGWGVDLERENRPGVPMERTPPRLEGVHWEAPEQQEPHIHVHHSIERPGITPVFGTSAPPSGLSGKLRDLAFRYSENDLRHWMILLLADRINVGEGLIDDLAHGHIPNILGEMGARAEWKHNRAGFVKKALLASAIVGMGVYVWRRRGQDD